MAKAPKAQMSFVVVLAGQLVDSHFGRSAVGITSPPCARPESTGDAAPGGRGRGRRGPAAGPGGGLQGNSRAGGDANGAAPSGRTRSSGRGRAERAERFGVRGEPRPLAGNAPRPTRAQRRLRGRGRLNTVSGSRRARGVRAPPPCRFDSSDRASPRFAHALCSTSRTRGHGDLGASPRRFQRVWGADAPHASPRAHVRAASGDLGATADVRTQSALGVPREVRPAVPEARRRPESARARPARDPSLVTRISRLGPRGFVGRCPVCPRSVLKGL